MSITNIISNDEVTLVQGVNGLFFYEESWVTSSQKATRSKEALSKEIIRTKKDYADIERLKTNLPDLT